MNHRAEMLADHVTQLQADLTRLTTELEAARARVGVLESWGVSEAIPWSNVVAIGFVCATFAFIVWVGTKGPHAD